MRILMMVLGVVYLGSVWGQGSNLRSTYGDGSTCDSDCAIRVSEFDSDVKYRIPLKFHVGDDGAFASDAEIEQFLVSVNSVFALSAFPLPFELYMESREDLNDNMFCKGDESFVCESLFGCDYMFDDLRSLSSNGSNLQKLNVFLLDISVIKDPDGVLNCTRTFNNCAQASFGDVNSDLYSNHIVFPPVWLTNEYAFAFAHEVGHYFNLYHTFGSYDPISNTNSGLFQGQACDELDGIEDTDIDTHRDQPVQYDLNNLMEYSDELTSAEIPDDIPGFTECQVAKMMDALSGDRSTLSYDLSTPRLKFSDGVEVLNDDTRNYSCQEALPVIRVLPSNASSNNAGLSKWRVRQIRDGVISDIGTFSGVNILDMNNVTDGNSGEFQVEVVDYLPWNADESDPIVFTITVDECNGLVTDGFQYPIGAQDNFCEEEHISPRTNNFYSNNPIADPSRGGSLPAGETGWYNVQDVGNYLNLGQTDGIHPGEDWNYNSGCDDAGQIVRASANGEVISVAPTFASSYETGGWTIVIKHTLPNGNIFYSVYTHVTSFNNTDGALTSNESDFNLQEGGSIVQRGQAIARVAKGNNCTGTGRMSSIPTHLHFEIRNDNYDGGELYPSDNGFGYYGSSIGERHNSGMTLEEVTNAYQLMQNDGIIDPSDFIRQNLPAGIVCPGCPITSLTQQQINCLSNTISIAVSGIPGSGFTAQEINNDTGVNGSGVSSEIGADGTVIVDVPFVFDPSGFTTIMVSTPSCSETIIIDRSVCSGPACGIQITDFTLFCLADGTYEASISFTGDGGLYNVFDNDVTTCTGFGGSTGCNYPDVESGTFTFGPITVDNPDYTITIEDDDNPTCSISQPIPAISDNCTFSCIEANCITYEVSCNGDGTYNADVTFDGVDGVSYTMENFIPGSADVYQPPSEVFPNVSGVNIITNIPIGQDVVAVVRETNVGVCTGDARTIRYFPDLALNVVPDCGANMFSVEVSIDAFAALGTYALSDGTTTTSIAGGDQVTMGPYTSGNNITFTLSDPANTACSVTAATTYDCGNPNTCDDGVMNNGELGVDCGGSCPPCVDCTPGFSTCPGTIGVGTDAGENFATVNYATPTLNAPCDAGATPTLTSGLASGSQFPIGVTEVIYTYEDVECRFSVVVSDNEPPQLSCAGSQTVFTEPGGCFGVIPDLTSIIEVEDNNDVESLFQFPGPGALFGGGDGEQVVVTVIAIDEDGNSSDCDITVRLADNESPEFTTCPTQTLVFGTDPDLCAVSANWSIPAATDNCQVSISHISGPLPGDLLSAGQIYTVVYEADDGANPPVTCVFNVEVIETQSPQINCPQDVFVESDPGVCEAAVENIQLEFAIDNCPFTVTWTSSPADVTGTGTSTATDASGAIFPVGTTTVTYQIRENDDFGNGNVVATCDLIVEVTDTEAPEITCPPSVTIGTDDDGAGNYDCATDYTWTHPTPTDNCAVTVYEVNYVNPDGSTEGPNDVGAAAGAMFSRNFPLGITTVRYRVEDAEGNVTECEWTVEVIDDEDPMIFCEENLATNEITYLGSLEIYPRDTVAAVISVPVSATISDVNIPALVGTHPDMGDLTVTLTSPAGTTITLFDGLCAGTPDFDLTLDDNTASSINTAPCNPLGGGGLFAPADALAVFNGENSQGDWVLTFSSELEGACGGLEEWDLEIVGNDNTVPPVNRLQVIADAGTCTYFLRNTDFDPRFTDNCDGAFITHDYLSGPFDTTLMGSTFPIGETEILWTVTDAAGNTAECPMIIEVLDNEAPRFTNCERPDIIANPTPGVCDAFVNFSLPLATDNCGDAAVTINQIDGTGLTTGMRFPVGTTILMYEALDAAGNRSDCEFRVIVNDNQDVVLTAASCPDDVETTMDDGDCEAVVNGLAPDFADNCGANLAYIFKILDQDGTEIANGFTDASGQAFPLGTNTVTYRAQDQPVLLITEITHEIQETLGGNDVIPPYVGFRGLPDGDFLEITNFGPARLNIGGLDIERITATGIDHFRVPALEILEPGETFVLQFGNDDASPADHYYAIECATDLTSSDGAAYVISHSGRVLDVAAINGFDPAGQGNAATVEAADWSGSIFDGLAGIRRASVYDDNEADDFVAATVCGEITIGQYNPDFAAVPSNGSLTSDQARKPNKEECSFTVTVTDDETAVCGSYQPYDDYTFSQPATIAPGDCFEATLNVTDAYQLADVNTTLVGAAGSFGNLRITLISPEGDEVILADNECADTPGFELILDSDSITRPFIYEDCAAINQTLHLRPRQDLNLFNTRPSAGTWTLRIAHDATEDFEDVTLESWTLSLSELIPYAQGDTTIENDFRECGADFTWLHTGIWDNCPGGSVQVTYLFKDTIQDTYVITRDRFGRDTTRFFDVGLTTVRYTLTDANGNVSECSFDLTVLDTEPPVLVCPADTTLFLAGGECDIVYRPIDWSVTDNCVIRDTMTSPDWNLPLPIGINPVDLTVTDTSGNATTCTYVVTVVEYDPPNPQMACVGDLNVSLGSDCVADIIPSMLLAGDEYYCFDNYEVTLLQEREDEPGVFDTLVNPTVGESQIGDTLIYQVYDPRNDDLCWGYLRVGFFEDPEFICPANTTIKCNGDFSPALNGEPILLSCALAGATTSYADTLQQFDACDDPRAIMRRTWLVEDAYGNSASCVQTITMEAFDLNDVVFPPNLDGDDQPALSCFDVANDPLLTEPANTGFPTVLDGSNVFQTNFCSASYLYTDEVYDICAGSFEIVRTWKVRSTCGAVVDGVNPIVGTQVIRVLDQENPLLVCPEPDTISTGGIACSGEYAVPVPVVEESCSAWTYEVTVSGGTLSFINGNYYLTDLEEGTTTIRYYVEDECGRFSECIYPVFVTDQQAANAACEDQINVSLDSNGGAVIGPDEIDAGSEDLCSAVSLRIRREFTLDPLDCSPVDPFFGPWRDSVAVNCCEVNETVKVELEVTDEDGNISVCWTNVLVEDKQAPACIPPAPVTVTCDDLVGNLPDDLDVALLDDPTATYTVLDATFGFAAAGDNCSGTTITQTVSDNRENCGVGEIVRRFTVTDAQGLSPQGACTQVITVEAVNNYVVAFPADTSSSSCSVPVYDTLSTTSTGCDLIIYNVSVDTFPAQGGECVLLRVNHEVINWCEYSTEADPYIVPRPVPFFNEVSERVYLHVVPGLTNDRDDDLALLSSTPDLLPGNLTGFLDRQDEGTTGYPAGLSGARDGTSTLKGYGTDPSRGHFVYHQFISVFDGIEPVIEVEAPADCLSGASEDCSATLELLFTAYDECSLAVPTVELDEDYVASSGFIPTTVLSSVEVVANGDSTYMVTRTGLPPGSHALRIRANDGCGNTDVQIVEFCVEADKAPTPICIANLTVTVMPDGQGGGSAVLWATDAIASDAFDCFGNPITRYSIYREADAGQADFSPQATDSSLVFDCTEDFGPTPVRVYAFDENGNADYCQMTVDVQVFAEDICDPDADRATIAGTILTSENDPVENVEVTLDNGATLPVFMTGEDGQFTFGQQLLGPDYTITPDHRSDYLNGVRTSDIVSITQHILGLEAFSSPYQLLAADVDGNEEVNVGDIISLRRLILGLAEAFPNNMPSWTFVGADYDFPQPANPWAEAFPTVANYNNLSANVLDADFIGVKLGDVNNSAVANSRSHVGTEAFGPAMKLEFPELYLVPGREYVVPVTTRVPAGYFGFQGELSTVGSGVRLKAVTSAHLQAEHFALDAERGTVRLSWNTNNGKAIPAAGDQLLFELVLVADEATTLSEALSLNTRSVAAEAYLDGGTTTGIALVFNEVLSAKGYHLYQNLPNPFETSTTIVFRLPALAAVEVTITDVTGRLVASYQLDGAAGRNMLEVKRADLRTPGVYTYTVTSGTWRASKRMIVR